MILEIDQPKILLSICIYTLILHMLNIRNYWLIRLGYLLVCNVMSQNKFELIKSILHFNNNSNMFSSNDLTCDELHKLWPIINQLSFAFIPYTNNLCVNEQLYSTKAYSYMKPYLLDKSHKWGFKFLILIDI